MIRKPAETDSTASLEASSGAQQSINSECPTKFNQHMRERLEYLLTIYQCELHGQDGTTGS